MQQFIRNNPLRGMANFFRKLFSKPAPSMAEHVAPIYALPNEMLRDVFEYVPDQRSLREVSRNFCVVYNNLYLTAHLKPTLHLSHSTVKINEQSRRKLYQQQKEEIQFLNKHQHSISQMGNDEIIHGEPYTDEWGESVSRVISWGEFRTQFNRLLNKLNTVIKGEGPLALDAREKTLNQINELIIRKQIAKSGGTKLWLDKITRFPSNVISAPDLVPYWQQIESLSIIGYFLPSFCFPHNIGNLRSLKQLSATRNCLTSLPESFSELSALEKLDLSMNRLVALPDTIGKLGALQKLNVSVNQLTVLPESIGQLRNLRELLLGDPIRGDINAQNCDHENKITHLPASICDLQLTKLYVGHNCLTELPDGITRMRSLEKLWIEYNCLKTLPEYLNENILIQSMLEKETTKKEVLDKQRPSPEYSVKEKIWTWLKSGL